MLHNIKTLYLTLVLGLVISASVSAYDKAPQNHPQNPNPKVSSDGGIIIGSTKDPYWFKLGGIFQIDQRSFLVNRRGTPYAFTPSTESNPAGTYLSGAMLRAVGLDLSGGVGQDFTYNIGLNFDSQDKKVGVDYAYLTYHGLRYLAPNFNISIGQVFPGFCISCTASGQYIPFMERDMDTNTFGPEQGLGVRANSYDNNFSATVAITQQPKIGSHVKSLNGTNIKSRDMWQASGRVTYAPVAEHGRLLQVGTSAHIQEYSNTGLEYKVDPEMKTNNSTTLLNTTYAVASGSNNAILISAKNQKTFDIEATGIYGPWSWELEYQKVFIKRGVNAANVKQGPNLSFSGYHAQASYILTGESRTHVKADGTIGQPDAYPKSGVWEISGRYSFITLNNKDISGGMAHNTTASLSWFANRNIRVIAEYVVSKQSRLYPAYLDKRTVSGIGARLQVIF